MKSQVYKRLGWNFIILGVLFLCMLFSLPSYASEKSVLTLRNPYILEISTGASAGDEIGAIKISYTTASGEERYKYLLPGGNDLGNSYKTAAYYGAGSGDDYGNLSRKVENAKSFGYTFDGWEDYNVKGLQANTTDYYIVDFPEKVGSIDLVELIPVLDQGDGIINTKRDRVDWQCLGFRFYEVARNNGQYAIYGLGMTGYLSDDFYIVYDGTLKAYLDIPSRGDQKCLNISQSAPTKIIFSTNSLESSSGVKLVNNSNVNYSNKNDSLYFLKIDIADTADAGVESYASQVGFRKSIRNYYLPETLVATVSYVTNRGEALNVPVPIVTSLMTSLMSDAGKGSSCLVDVAGQGESMVVPLYLPDCREITYVRFNYGTANIEDKCGMKEFAYGQSERDRIRNLIDSRGDSLSITDFYIMEKKLSSSETILSTDASYMTLENEAILVAEESKYSIVSYNTSGEVEGITLKNNSFNMSYAPERYSEGVNIIPQDTSSKYLIAFDTDIVAEAGCSADINVSFRYTDLSGRERETKKYSMGELTKNFYGFWPDSEFNDAGAKVGQQSGHTVYGVLSLDNVDKFSEFNFSIDNGEDDWQLAGLKIYRITSWGKRSAEWLSGTKQVGDISIDRMFYRSVNKVYLYDTGFKPGASTLNSNSIECVTDIQQVVYISPSMPKSLSFTGKVKRQATFDWTSEYYKSMSYDITKKRLGFNDRSYVYNVVVNVSNDIDDGTGNGDCGSNNLFYFQLVFYNGTSGIVEANSQLAGDGFITGASEEFKISVNRDYGDLRAIRIISDNTQNNANIYDKLKIDTVEVSCLTSDGADTTSVFDIYDWIGIDPVEDANENTSRTMGELARSFFVSEQTVNITMEFVLSMSHEVGEESTQFEGNVVADIQYQAQNGEIKTHQVDVTGAIYDYASKTAKGQNIGGMMRSVSDRTNMFRPGHSDRFLVTIPNISKLISIRFYCLNPNRSSSFAVESVGVNRISSSEGLFINKNDEYELSCEIRKNVCTNTDKVRAVDCLQNTQVATDIIRFTDQDEMMFRIADIANWPFEADDGSNKQEWLRILANSRDFSIYEWPLPDEPGAMYATVEYTDVTGQSYITTMPMTIRKENLNEDGSEYRYNFAVAGVGVRGISTINRVAFRTGGIYISDDSFKYDNVFTSWIGMKLAQAYGYNGRWSPDDTSKADRLFNKSFMGGDYWKYAQDRGLTENYWVRWDSYEDILAYAEFYKSLGYSSSNVPVEDIVGDAFKWAGYSECIGSFSIARDCVIERYEGNSLTTKYNVTIGADNLWVSNKADSPKGAYSTNITISPEGAGTVLDTEETQKVYLQLGDITDGMVLESKQKDIGVRIIYTSSIESDDPMVSSIQYKSSFVYLSDVCPGYLLKNSIDGKEVCALRDYALFEIPFKESYVGEIVGVEVAATGNLSISMTGMAVSTMPDDKWYSIYPTGERDLSVTNGSVEFEIDSIGKGEIDTVIPIEMEIVTAPMENGINTGTSDNIQMIIKSGKSYDNTLISSEIKDLNKYVVEGDFLESGHARVRTLVKGMNDIQSIVLRPFDGVPTIESSWVPEKMLISAVAGTESDAPLVLYIGTRIYESKGIEIGVYPVDIKVWGVNSLGNVISSTDESSCIRVTGENPSINVGYSMSYDTIKASTEDYGAEITVYQVDSSGMVMLEDAFTITDDLGNATKTSSITTNQIYGEVTVNLPTNITTTEQVYRVYVRGIGRYAHKNSYLEIRLPVEERPLLLDFGDLPFDISGNR